MKKVLGPIFAMSLAIFIGAGAGAVAEEADYLIVPSDYGNDSLGSQLSYDSFHQTIKRRMESLRLGSFGGMSFGGRAPAPARYGGSYGGGYGGAYRPPSYSGPQIYGPPPQNYGAPQGYNSPTYGSPQNFGSYNAQPNYGGGGQIYSAPSYDSGFGGGGAYEGSGQNTYGNDYNTQNSGFAPNYGNGYSSTFASDSAFAAPYYGGSSYSSDYRRRQLDCVYYSGFTVWGDLYATFGKQNSDGWEDGYSFRTVGPAIGFDWTNGPLSLGLATTYAWGKLDGSDFNHHRSIRTWGVEGYLQYNTDVFYVNGTLGYSHNKFDSDRQNSYAWNSSAYYNNLGYYNGYANSASYSSNSFNVEAEFGWKFLVSGFNISPHAGFRYYHDNRGSFSENGSIWYNGQEPVGNENVLNMSSKSYHVFEMPLGVNVSYPITSSNGTFWIPRVGFAWIPTLSRSGSDANGAVVNPSDTAVDPKSFPYRYYDETLGAYSWNSKRRATQGFQLSVGLEARLTKSLTGHIDYDINFRSGAHEHYWKAGVGFTF